MSKNIFRHFGLSIQRGYDVCDGCTRFLFYSNGKSISSMLLEGTAKELAEFLSTPYVPELTPAQVKAKQLEETIKKAQKELAELSKEIS